MEALAAIADPTRRSIIEMLAMAEHSAGEIVAAFKMTGAAISQHLKVLRMVGLVRVRSEGQRRIHSLDANGLRDIELWAARTRQVWESRLDALERELHAQDAMAAEHAKAKASPIRRTIKS